MGACGPCPLSGARCAGLGCRGLSCWWALVALWAWAVIAIWGGFCSPGGLLIVSVELGAPAPRLPRFILLVSFSDTLLAVSILDKSMIAI